MKRTSLRARLLSAPYIVWAAIFIVVPLFIVVYYAFTDRSGVFSLSNITALADYKDTFIISVWYSVIATVITLVIAYPFAYALSRFGANTQRMMMLLVMLPMWMNLLIRTYSWMNILERNGIINNVLAGFGIEPLKMIGTPGAVILGMVYNYLPYMILPIYTVMSKLDITLLEAADDLGANAFQRLRTLVIPLSMPGVISGITMVFVPVRQHLLHFAEARRRKDHADRRRDRASDTAAVQLQPRGVDITCAYGDDTDKHGDNEPLCLR